MGFVVLSPTTWLVISLTLSGIALFLPLEGTGRVVVVGWEMALLGWVFPLFGGTLVWYSGPAIVVAWLAIAARAPNLAIVFALAALALTLFFIVGPTTTMRPEAELRLGYYVWVAALCCALMSGFLLSLKTQRSDANMGSDPIELPLEVLKEEDLPAWASLVERFKALGFSSDEMRSNLVHRGLTDGDARAVISRFVKPE